MPSAKTFALLEPVSYERKFCFEKWRHAGCNDVSWASVRTVAGLRGALVCPEGVGTGRWGHISHLLAAGHCTTTRNHKSRGQAVTFLFQMKIRYDGCSARFLVAQQL